MSSPEQDSPSQEGNEIRLAIPAKVEYVALARMIVASIATANDDLPEERIDDLKLAVSEACTNAIESHEAGNGSQDVVVRCRDLGSHIEIVVEDSGPPVGAEEQAIVETSAENLDFERGLGIPLIRTLVDEVFFEPSRAGSSVHMVMRGASQRVS